MNKPPQVTPTDPRIRSGCNPQAFYEADLPGGTRAVIQESIVQSGQFYCYRWPKPPAHRRLQLDGKTLNAFEAMAWLQSQLSANSQP